MGSCQSVDTTDSQTQTHASTTDLQPVTGFGVAAGTTAETVEVTPRHEAAMSDSLNPLRSLSTATASSRTASASTERTNSDRDWCPTRATPPMLPPPKALDVPFEVAPADDAVGRRNARSLPPVAEQQVERRVTFVDGVDTRGEPAPAFEARPAQPLVSPHARGCASLTLAAPHPPRARRCKRRASAIIPVQLPDPAPDGHRSYPPRGRFGVPVDGLFDGDVAATATLGAAAASAAPLHSLFDPDMVARTRRSLALSAVATHRDAPPRSRSTSAEHLEALLAM